MINYDKEYHPVMEDYICAYAEGTMSDSELHAFEEVMCKDEELRTLAMAAKKGRACMLHALESVFRLNN